MIFLLFAIACSVSVSILFKLFKRYSVDPQESIIFNYPVASALCMLFLKLNLSALPSNNNWILFTSTAILLISIFTFVSKSIYTSGIVVTAIAQRLSLIIPVLAAFLFFNESLTLIKTLGLFIGFIAIYASKPSVKRASSNINFWYPLIVFSGTGIIDILFNIIAKNSRSTFSLSLFYIFSIASIIGFFWLFYRWIFEKKLPGIKSLLGGFILGILNFGSIFFYIKALSVEVNRPSVVFSALDIGVITMSSITGIFLFKEKLSSLNKFSIALAIVAIAILTFSN